MAKSNTRLELTWIGKENRPKLEPRVLIEDASKSYHASQRVSKNDIFDNRLIFGDNLLALKALEHEFTGKIKCIFIDPPYNTGSAFSHYDDGIEHSLWLSLMRDRLELLRNLLSDDGSLWITIDDNECHYLKVLCDEIFGRVNFVANCLWQKVYSERMDATGFSTSHDHVLVYRKTDRFQVKPIPKVQNAGQFGFFDKQKQKYYRRRSLRKEGSESLRQDRPSMWYPIEAPDGTEVWPVKPDGTEGRWRWKSENVILQKDDLEFVNKDGKWEIYVKQYIEDNPTRPPSTLWMQEDVGHNHEAKLEVKEFNESDIFSTPKPERLLRHIMRLATEPGDTILDSFAGSGTTGAVAHKMGRRWIMVELGEHCQTHIIPRMKKIIDGMDYGGISIVRDLIWEAKLSPSILAKLDPILQEAQEIETESVNKYEKIERKIEDSNLRIYGICKPASQRLGGGGFRYYRIGPSLIVNDQWGNPVINPEFNAALLAEAMCKIEGFTFDPNPDIYWQQGRSNETDFIYVTTQMMTHEMLAKLSDDVGPKRSLLVCCGAFRCDVSEFENLTVKKIPKAVLRKCEWGHDDYSLEIKNLPAAPETRPEEVLPPEENLWPNHAGSAGRDKNRKPVRKFGKGKDAGPSLFDKGDT